MCEREERRQESAVDGEHPLERSTPERRVADRESRSDGSDRPRPPRDQGVRPLTHVERSRQASDARAEGYLAGVDVI